MATTKSMTRHERIDALVAIYGWECFYPGCDEILTRETATFDHWWTPQSQGGTWDLDNLRLMSKACNARKGDRIPDSEGQLPPLKRELGLANRRAVRRGARPELCGKCENGRELGPQESCNVCGSGPMPERWPRWAKVRPSECDHSEFWCWLCGSGIIDRTSVVTNLITGE